MSTVISDSNFRTSICPMIDQQFDLDQALTLPDQECSTSYDDEDRHQVTRVSETSQNPLICEYMPISTIDVDSCAVCMERFHSGETGGRISCGHVYHESCIAAWLSVCNSCPLCRCRISRDIQLLCAGKH